MSRKVASKPGDESPGYRRSSLPGLFGSRSHRFPTGLIPALRFGLVESLTRSAPCVGPARPEPRHGFVALPDELRSNNGVEVLPTSGSESPGPRVASLPSFAPFSS
ncbi:MAG TPA: hypothetical protein DCQ98_06930 [Planctomycetaceae bacterium]|nr:hypothetical protein [Planctomycetaceae bacterium]